MTKNLAVSLLVAASFFLGGLSSALGQQVHCSGTIAAWQSDASLRGFMSTHSCSCPGGNSRSPVCVPIGGKGASGKSKPPTPADFRTIVVGAMFQSILSSVFADDSSNEKEILAAQQKAAEIAWKKTEQKRAEEAKAQAEYDRMMLSYKQLEGAGQVAFKTLSDSDLGLKGLEELAATSRQPFDTAAELKEPDFKSPTGGTAFFGDTMPIEDIRFLVNPENDPNVVDLTKARTFVVENLKTDPQKIAAATREQEKKAEAPPKAPECAKLLGRLKDYVNQREKFHKTIELAQSELATWQAANRNALMNAARDGIDYFIGRLLDYLSRKGEAADRLMRILNADSVRMAQDGIDVAQVAAKIKRLKLLSNAGRVAEYTSDVKDWNKLIKDGLSAMVAELSESNREVKQMLAEPAMQRYFETEAPALNALLDISTMAASHKVFGKWVAKQVPIIAAVELGINQFYNGLDYYLSYKGIAEAHKINGQVLKTARGIQNNIDRTYDELRACE